MKQKLFSVGMVLILILLVALPAAAQGDFTVTPAQLQATFAEYVATGFALNFDLDVERASFALADGSVRLEVAVLGLDKASPLLAAVVVAPVVADGAVSWRYVDATFSDGAGSPVELTEAQMRGLFQTVRNAWASAYFEDSVRTAREMGLATDDNVYVEEISFVDGAISVLVNNEHIETVRAGGPEGEQAILITQDQMNRAFAALAGRFEGVNSFMVEISGVNAGYRVSLGNVADGTSNTLLLSFVPNPNFSGFFGTETFTYLATSGRDAPLVLDRVTLENGEAAPEALAQRAAEAVVRATNHYLAMQADPRQVSGFIIFIGTLEIHVATGDVNGDGVVRGGGERIEISQAQLNRAFAAMAARSEQVDALTVEFLPEGAQFTLETNGWLNYEEIKYLIMPDSWSWGLTQVCCIIQEPLLEPSAQSTSLLQFEIQDFMTRVWDRVTRSVAGDQRVIGTEYDAARGIIAILIG